jgi:hypothetical protein
MAGQFIFIDKMESVVKGLDNINLSLVELTGVCQTIYEEMVKLRLQKPIKKIVAKKKKL